jgi:hypothetical protein
VASGEFRPTAFWRLFDDASKLVLGETLSLAARLESSVWTNLSKLGEEGLPKPRDVNGLLHSLDVAQLKYELDELKPAVLLCVSGSALEDTGYAVFGDWPRLDVETKTTQTEVRRVPHGGILFWTMHPNRKSSEWRENVLDDLSSLLERKRV